MLAQSQSRRSDAVLNLREQLIEKEILFSSLAKRAVARGQIRFRRFIYYGRPRHALLTEIIVNNGLSLR